ncbi:phosphate ABC transporter permease subunit PstC [Pseudactinotalea sp. HY158]|uniref:phosphate ABC transporter permease subunit PstC n=1 Tax=unclassified Pseudactinotalea TaxID=2649176 RepID=UPI00129CF0C9|nr:phosphate ABC transporter permease subunit PstC [Pseudactinotalea sp. HY158]MPV50424.1 phosphate ABC transporter permease subunit PstC [Pseudactinotalea sp. HY160]QGH70548.1 phosphate ABC transporter permease subunit PstC [Pseudactinotalea sp. HY158]
MTSATPRLSPPSPASSGLGGESRSGRFGNRLFAAISTGAGVTILIALAAVAAFLLVRAWPAFTASPGEVADATQGAGFWGYVAPLAFGTVLSSAIALVIAVPLSIGIALFISHYAPRRLASGLGYLIDLLAAIPSVVFGLWGMAFLQPLISPVLEWLSSTLGFIPIFAGYQAPARNVLTAGIVLAVMIMPIITATIREVFLQVPRLHEEASLALGATRWEMIRQAVLPFGKSGIISASMLGLGRALGETMAVLMVLSPGFAINFFLLKPGQHSSIAANIAAQFPESSGIAVDVLIATGLILFILTFAVNLLARWIVARRAQFDGAN